MNIKKIINENNLKLKKHFGQNFIINDNILVRIVEVSEISKNDLVIEIGPGLGVLTKHLAEKAKHVIAVEIDSEIIDILKNNLREFNNITIINEDILKTHIDSIISKYNDLTNVSSIKVVANLPYYITTPIIIKLLEETNKINKMVLMVQKEVADRIAASPNCKEYGALSIYVQFFTEPKIEFNVSPNNFIPKPEVMSSVISLNKRPEPPVSVINKDTFFKLVKASFNQRRKTILNALSNSVFISLDKNTVRQILINAKIDLNRRGETLSLQEFANISNQIVSFCKK